MNQADPMSLGHGYSRSGDHICFDGIRIDQAGRDTLAGFQRSLADDSPSPTTSIPRPSPHSAKSTQNTKHRLIQVDQPGPVLGRRDLQRRPGNLRGLRFQPGQGRQTRVAYRRTDTKRRCGDSRSSHSKLGLERPPLRLLPVHTNRRCRSKDVSAPGPGVLCGCQPRLLELHQTQRRRSEIIPDVRERHPLCRRYAARLVRRHSIAERRCSELPYPS